MSRTTVHLRKVASIMRMVNELERIGDYAVIIAREALQLPHPPTGQLREEMEQMARQAENYAVVTDKVNTGWSPVMRR